MSKTRKQPIKPQKLDTTAVEVVVESFLLGGLRESLSPSHVATQQIGRNSPPATPYNRNFMRIVADMRYMGKSTRLVRSVSDAPIIRPDKNTSFNCHQSLKCLNLNFELLIAVYFENLQPETKVEIIVPACG